MLIIASSSIGALLFSGVPRVHTGASSAHTLCSDDDKECLIEVGFAHTLRLHPPPKHITPIESKLRAVIKEDSDDAKASLIELGFSNSLRLNPPQKKSEKARVDVRSAQDVALHELGFSNSLRLNPPPKKSEKARVDVRSVQDVALHELGFSNSLRLNPPPKKSEKARVDVRSVQDVALHELGWVDELGFALGTSEVEKSAVQISIRKAPKQSETALRKARRIGSALKPMFPDLSATNKVLSPDPSPPLTATGRHKDPPFDGIAVHDRRRAMRVPRE